MGKELVQKRRIDDKKRIWELDFLRGACVSLMILDHILYDLAYVFPEICRWLCISFAKEWYFQWPLRQVLWVLVVSCFVGLCGISCSFSRFNWRRGLKLAAVAAVLTLATWTMDRGMETEQFTIRFGVIHMLAASILLYCMIKGVGKWGMLALGILSIATGVYYILYPLETDSTFLACLINTHGAFRSADYFPLLPWLGVFLIGVIWGPILYKEKKSHFPKRGREAALKPFLWMGRHALLIYVFHQPVIYGFLVLISGLVTGEPHW